MKGGGEGEVVRSKRWQSEHRKKVGGWNYRGTKGNTRQKGNRGGIRKSGGRRERDPESASQSKLMKANSHQHDCSRSPALSTSSSSRSSHFLPPVSPPFIPSRPSPEGSSHNQLITTALIASAAERLPRHTIITLSLSAFTSIPNHFPVCWRQHPSHDLTVMVSVWMWVEQCERWKCLTYSFSPPHEHENAVPGFYSKKEVSLTWRKV